MRFVEEEIGDEKTPTRRFLPKVEAYVKKLAASEPDLGLCGN